MKKTALAAGACAGLLGVGLGAFGAHGLEDLLTRNGRLDTWQTAVFYQFVHAGLLLLLGILQERPARALAAATWLAVAGILVFSGSLYLLALTDIKWLGAITPLGGLAFIAAWALLLIHSLRTKTPA